MFGFITRKYHLAVVAAFRDAATEAEASATYWRAQADNARAARNAEKERAIKSGRLASELLAERDAALAELDKLKSARARSNANLIAANEARRAKVPA